MKWIKSSEITIDYSREYIAKYGKAFVNNGRFLKDGLGFMFDCRQYGVITELRFSNLYILVDEKELSSCTLSDWEIEKMVDINKDFLISALNFYWHDANTQLAKKNLGDIERSNYEFQLKKSKEIMDAIAGYKSKPSINLPSESECMEKAVQLALHIPTKFRDQNLQSLITFCQTSIT